MQALRRLGNFGPDWYPPWESPAPYELAPAAQARPAKSPQDHLASSEEHIGPIFKHPEEPVVWSPGEVAALKERLPSYDIHGPGVYAICEGESGLFGVNSRLLAVRRGVLHVEDAAHMCDSMRDCTHFSVTVGPDGLFGWEPPQGLPYRADFCKGRLVSMAKVDGLNTFVGVKRRSVALEPPVEESRCVNTP